MMACHVIKFPGGGRAFICGPRERVRRCSCGAPATLLCDWKGKSVKACDRPICEACARNVGPDKDLCPEHAAAYRGWLAERERQGQLQL